MSDILAITKALADAREHFNKAFLHHNTKIADTTILPLSRSLVFFSGLELSMRHLVLFFQQPVWLTHTSFRLFTMTALSKYVHTFFPEYSRPPMPAVNVWALDPEGHAARYFFRFRKEFEENSSESPSLTSDNKGNYTLNLPGECLLFDFRQLRTFDYYPIAYLAERLDLLDRPLEHSISTVFANSLNCKPSA